MTGIINGIEQIIFTTKAFWDIIVNIFVNIGTAFTYITTIETKLVLMITNLPLWIRGYMLATLLISILYIVIGRVGGHSS